jgi:hypothetical protein
MKINTIWLHFWQNLSVAEENKFMAQNILIESQ